MLFQFEMPALLGGQLHRGKGRYRERERRREREREREDRRERERGGEGDMRGREREKEREKGRGKTWYGTFVSNPIPHTTWLHYHYAAEKTSVSLKIKTYLAPSVLTPNETCLSLCVTVLVLLPSAHIPCGRWRD